VAGSACTVTSEELDSILKNGGFRRTGIRLFPSNAMANSQVDNLVFGRDFDRSGEHQFAEEYKSMFTDAAGCPSWVERPRGLRSSHQSHPFTSLMGASREVGMLGCQDGCAADGAAEGIPGAASARRLPKQRHRGAGLDSEDFASIVFGSDSGKAERPPKSQSLSGRETRHKRYQAYLRSKARDFLRRAGMEREHHHQGHSGGRSASLRAGTLQNQACRDSPRLGIGPRPVGSCGESSTIAVGE